MDLNRLAREIIGKYEQHGWKLRQVLLRPEVIGEVDQETLTDVEVKESDINALWFSRPSPKKRDAWELRLLQETPFALFETFEPDESEEQRDERRREMEAHSRSLVSG